MYKKHGVIGKIGVCLALAAMAAVQTSAAQISTGENPVQTSPAQGLRVLFIGDSITDGNWGEGGGAKPSAERNHWDKNHIFGSGYMYLCAAHYGSLYPEAGQEFFNRGISGEGVADMAARWEEDVVEMRPDLLSVLVGINDVHRFVERERAAEAADKSGAEGSSEPGEFAREATGVAAAFDIAGWESAYRRLLERAREQNPDLRLVLCTPFTSRPEYREATEECALAVERMAADYDAVLVSYDAMFAALAIDHPAVPVSHWLWDGIHPTAAGHGRMAALWIECVGLLGE